MRRVNFCIFVFSFFVFCFVFRHGRLHFGYSGCCQASGGIGLLDDLDNQRNIVYIYIYIYIVLDKECVSVDYVLDRLVSNPSRVYSNNSTFRTLGRSLITSHSLTACTHYHPISHSQLSGRSAISNHSAQGKKEGRTPFVIGRWCISFALWIIRVLGEHVIVILFIIL
jgi:hypothetical protein